jgi:HD-like signal output (HDOD) protein
VDGEFAFMAGLLHDVGIAGTLLALSDQKKPRQAPPDLIAIWPSLHRMHERAGEIMAEHWELPQEIRTVLAAHHNVLVKGAPDPLTATVCLADELAHDAGYGVVPKEEDRVGDMSALEADCVRSHTSADRSSEKTLQHAREALGFGEAEMQTVRAEAEELAERIG